jgi:hypothetical protein
MLDGKFKVVSPARELRSNKLARVTSRAMNDEEPTIVRVSNDETEGRHTGCISEGAQCHIV